LTRNRAWQRYGLEKRTSAAKAVECSEICGTAKAVPFVQGISHSL
jgi:hypothetical protein